jgi:squalene-hopene/tetraprenyl-beta-curcumene cyclase
MDLQNADGGIPTFCRGWGTLPFDRSGPELTAHALRALAAWKDDLPDGVRARVEPFARRGLAFLAGARGPGGAWSPLWFGNERAPGEENPVYGTSRVLLALRDVARAFPGADVAAMAAGGADWLLKAQNPDGGWGGDRGVPSTLEETALAVEGLSAAADGEPRLPSPPVEAVKGAVAKGAAWLAEHGQNWKSLSPAPVGLYFAKLWYWEKLYPLIFAAAAFGRARKILE